MTWCNPGMKAPKKVKTGKSDGKIMAIVFWDAKGTILNHCVPSSITVNPIYHCNVLREVKAALCCNWPELRKSDVFLLHDNVRSYSSKFTLKFLAMLEWFIFRHPMYSLDLAPSDF